MKTKMRPLTAAMAVSAALVIGITTVAQLEQHRTRIVGPERFAATCRTLHDLLGTLTTGNDGP